MKKLFTNTSLGLYILCLVVELNISTGVFPELDFLRYLIVFIGVGAALRNNKAIVLVVNTIVILGSLAVMREKVIKEEAKIYLVEKAKLEAQLLPIEKKQTKSDCHYTDINSQTTCIQNEKYILFKENKTLSGNIKNNQKVLKDLQNLKTEIELYDFPEIWLFVIFSFAIPVCAHFAAVDLPKKLEKPVDVEKEKSPLAPLSERGVVVEGVMTIELYEKILEENKKGESMVSLAHKYGFPNRHALRRAIIKLKRSASYLVEQENTKSAQDARTREQKRAESAQDVRTTRADCQEICVLNIEENSNIYPFEIKKGA